MIRSSRQYKGDGGWIKKGDTSITTLGQTAAVGATACYMKYSIVLSQKATVVGHILFYLFYFIFILFHFILFIPQMNVTSVVV